MSIKCNVERRARDNGTCECLKHQGKGRPACFYCRYPLRGQKLDAKEFVAMDPDLKLRGVRTWLAELCASHELDWAAALLKADAS